MTKNTMIALWVYRIGIGFIIFILVLQGLQISDLLNPRSNLFLFGWSIFHVCLLFTISFLPKIDKAVLSNKIQTAGYLYTLIAFVSIFFILQGNIQNSEGIKDFLTPMGTALSTSILGWFLGGEVEENTIPKEENDAGEYAQKIATEFREFLGKIKSENEQYISTLHKTNIEFEKLYNNQYEIYQNAASLTNIVELVVDELKTAANQLKISDRIRLDEYSQKLTQTFISLNRETSNTLSSVTDIAKNLNVSNDLILEVNNLSGSIKLINQDYIQSLKTANIELNSIVKTEKNISERIQHLFITLNQLVENLNEATIKMRVDSDFGETVNSVTKEFVSLKNNVKTSSESVKNLSLYFEQSIMLVKKMEELLDYIVQLKVNDE